MDNLTEKEAWLKIAERFRDYRPDHGICSEIYDLWDSEKIDLQTFNGMSLKIRSLFKSNGSDYLFPIRCVNENFKQEYDILRVEVCEKFAAEIS